MLEGKCSTVDNLVDGTSRQSLIEVRETLPPLEKQFHIMERLFERLVAKTTLLEGEEKKKKGEHVRLTGFLDKKKTQFWAMNEQSKVVVTVICYSNKDTKEKPPDIIIDDEKRELILHSKLEKHITHAMDSHLLLQVLWQLLWVFSSPYLSYGNQSTILQLM
ncbi:hypothetical protein GQ457_10G020060 [Hibiscus cannabinus]